MLAQDDVPQEIPTLDESDRCVFVCELVCVNLHTLTCVYMLYHTKQQPQQE